MHPFFVAFRAVAMGKSRFGMNLDVVFDALPIVLPVTNLFATATNRKQTLELGDMLVQPKDPVGDLDAGCQLLRIKGLGHKIIRTGFHRFEIICFPFERSEQDKVGVIVAR